jgi:hypothetical protein
MAKVNFDKLSRMEQRVVIAKDLIARLKRGTFTPRTSTYLRVSGLDGHETDARKALREAECRGCQIGGLFICALDRHNRLALSDLKLTGGKRDWRAFDGALRDYLTKWFSHDELDLVEGFFEGFNETEAMYRFVGLVEEPIDRMRMIAQNIVDGKGRFSAARLMKTTRAWGS